MTDVAGIVLSVVTAWKTCIEVFDIVQSGRNYGMEYQILRVKLEVERIRLIMWGESLGLADVDSLGSGTSRAAAVLARDDVRETVLRLLGCVQHAFESTHRFEERYGLRLVTTLPPAIQDWESPPQSQGILDGVFKRAYEMLRRSARQRQQVTPLRKKALWAVYDGKKFSSMIAELKGFNDNLQTLVPD
ncbi:hypothetical protein BT69DRAFT_1188125, partial [Atractiella rhizophila]